MYDITDDPDFGKCARCEYMNISECIATCPRCGYDLGPTNSYFIPSNPELCPANPSVHSYITFECSYPGRLKLVSNKTSIYCTIVLLLYIILIIDVTLIILYIIYVYDSLFS